MNHTHNPHLLFKEGDELCVEVCNAETVEQCEVLEAAVAFFLCLARFLFFWVFC